MFRGEHTARAAKAVDDLVGDQQDAMTITDFAQSSPITVGRHHDAAGSGDRFGNHRRDGFRIFIVDHLLDLIGAKQIAAGMTVTEIATVAIGWGCVQHTMHEGAMIGLAHGPGTTDTHGAVCGTVIGTAPANDLGTFWLAIEIVILPGDLDGAFNRLRAARAEKGGSLITRGQFRQPGRQLDRRNGRRLGRAGIG